VREKPCERSRLIWVAMRRAKGGSNSSIANTFLSRSRRSSPSSSIHHSMSDKRRLQTGRRRKLTTPVRSTSPLPPLPLPPPPPPWLVPTRTKSIGCGSGRKQQVIFPPSWQSLAGSRDVELNLASQRRPFRVSLPASYGASTRPPALMLHFHHWGGTLMSGGVFHNHGIAHGYIGTLASQDSPTVGGTRLTPAYIKPLPLPALLLAVASPLGFDDDRTKQASWNGAGTAASSTQGRTCYDPSNSFAGTCYTRSCGRCNDSWCAQQPAAAHSRLALAPTRLPPSLPR
jgi:hypothetical protein